MIKKILIITVALLLAACSNSLKKEDVISQEDEQQLEVLIGKLKTNKPHQFQVKNIPISNKKLAKMYNEWAGTRYLLGGKSKEGIDCSAFIQEAFTSVYGIDLPRSTSEQQSVGKKIKKNELKPGDLVFFRKNRHVGIYLGNNRFMHASTSEGVTISLLNNNYWQKTYTQSRRVF